MGKTIRVGKRVEVTDVIDLQPYAILEPGEQGRVVEVSEDVFGNYAVNVHLDTTHKGLAPWDNCALLVTPECYLIKPVRHAYESLAAGIGGAGLLIYGLAKVHALYYVWGMVSASLAIIANG